MASTRQTSADTLRSASAHTLITVGRAAEMLRVTRQAVRKFMRCGELQAECEVEATRGTRQLLFRKGEIHRFAQLRAERWRRMAPSYGPQLALPLRASAAAATARPISREWRLYKFKPAMLPGRLKAKPMVVDRQPKHPGKSREKHRVA